MEHRKVAPIDHMPKCTAKRQDGQPCSKNRMRGQLVCATHGGKAPQNLAAARRREAEAIAALFFPALARVEDLLRDKDTPPAVVAALFRDLADRRGHQARKIVEMHSLDDGAMRDALAAAEAELAEYEDAG